MANAASTEPGPVQERKSIVAPAGGIFAKLKLGATLYIRPTIPRSAEGHEYRVRHIEGARAELQKSPGDDLLSLCASAVAQFQSPDDDHGRPTMVLRGRLQWLTASRRWVCFPEEPRPESPLGLAKSASPEDPRVLDFVARLRQAGYSPWWIPEEVTQEFLAQGGEVIYDEDGRYLRTQHERSSWVLLGKPVGPHAGSSP